MQRREKVQEYREMKQGEGKCSEALMHNKSEMVTT